MSDTVERLKSALAERYTIQEELGAGGMATVYLAQDVKHDRPVAVKVLRPELAAVLGAERFLQEIKTTANLQHPHILPLFDSGEADSFLYYVMPFIDGETLRDKLNRETQLGIDEAVSITTAIADALDYAHRNNVIHRDIKPENILLHDGRPMVVDFGIALALSAAAGGRMTETGLSLGTPHYMSPEQATAEKDLTHRSDIYSLGSMLYEMLTGSPPHVGSSAQQIIMKIVTDDARPVTELRKSVPLNVSAATAKSLEKLPADRFHTAAEFAEALNNTAFTTTSVISDGVAVRRPRQWQVPTLIGVSVTLLVVALLGWLRPQVGQVFRLSIAFSEDAKIQRVPTRRFAISPDGERIVYVGPGTGTGPRQLWMRELTELVARPLDGTELPAAVFFSPDGRSIGFVDGSPGDLKVLSLDGGPVRTVATDSINQWGGDWGPDNWLYFSMSSGRLARVRAGGGTVETVVAPDSADLAAFVEYDWPEALPSGTGLVFQIWRGSLANADIASYSFETGEVRILENAVNAKYVPTGHLVYVTFDGSLFARPFDQDRLEFTGEPFALEAGIRTEAFGGIGQFDISSNGHMVYQSGGAGAPDQIVRVDRSGVAAPIDPDWRGAFETVRVSPDGSMLVVGVAGAGGSQIWAKQLDRGPFDLLSFEGNANNRPAWLPSGRDLTFVGDRGTLWRVRADGGAPPQEVQVGAPVSEAEWSKDGVWLVFRTGSTGSGTRDIGAMRVGADSFNVIVGSPADEYAPALSPDGRWLAYTSNETGREEVYVRSFPDTDRIKRRVSVNGGTEPLWSPNSRELFLRNASGEVVVHVVRTDGESFDVEPQETLFDASEYLSDNYHATYDITPDGRHFVMIQALEIGGGDIILAINWLEELKAKVENE